MRCECNPESSTFTRQSFKSDQWQSLQTSHSASQLLAQNPTIGHSKSTAVQAVREALLSTSDRKSMRDWFRIVECYSALGLTKDVDILPALSGLAQSFALRAENGGNSLGSYHTGLWQRHFPYNLLWYSERGCGGRTYNYRAPTWSWASVKGPTKLEVSDVNEEPDIILRARLLVHRAKCSLIGQDLFGQIKSGFLVAEACLWLANGPFAELLDLQSGWHDVEMYFDDPAFDTQNIPIYCIEVLNAWPTGLLLRPVGPAEYERVGFYKFWRALSVEEQSWRSMFSFHGTIKIV
jgi:hypothetical protein